MSVAFSECCADKVSHWYSYAECYYAECFYAECYYAECYYAECYYAECWGNWVIFGLENLSFKECKKLVDHFGEKKIFLKM